MKPNIIQCKIKSIFSKLLLNPDFNKQETAEIVITGELHKNYIINISKNLLFLIIFFPIKIDRI